MRSALGVVALLAAGIVSTSGEAAEADSTIDPIKWVRDRLEVQMGAPTLEAKLQQAPIREASADGTGGSSPLTQEPSPANPSTTPRMNAIGVPQRASHSRPEQPRECPAPAAPVSSFTPAYGLDESSQAQHCFQQGVALPTSAWLSRTNLGIDGALEFVRLHDPQAYSITPPGPYGLSQEQILSSSGFQFSPPSGSSSNGQPSEFWSGQSQLSAVPGSSSTDPNGLTAGIGASLASLQSGGLGYLVEGSYFSGGDAATNDLRTLISARLALVTLWDYHRWAVTFLGGLRYFSTTFDYLSPQQQLTVPVVGTFNSPLGQFTQTLNLPLSSEYNLFGGELGADLITPFSAEGLSIFCRARLAVLGADRILSLTSQSGIYSSFSLTGPSSAAFALETNLGVGVMWCPPALPNLMAQAHCTFQSISLPGSSGSGSDFLLLGALLQASLAYRF